MPFLRPTEFQTSFTKKCNRFQQLWNGLYTRSTTEREDLISIVTILLGFRPAEVTKIPEESKLCSLLQTQDVLRLSMIYRERWPLIAWSEAHEWLPTVVEEVPILAGGGVVAKIAT